MYVGECKWEKWALITVIAYLPRDRCHLELVPRPKANPIWATSCQMIWLTSIRSHHKTLLTSLQIKYSPRDIRIDVISIDMRFYHFLFHKRSKRAVILNYVLKDADRECCSKHHTTVIWLKQVILWLVNSILPVHFESQKKKTTFVHIWLVQSDGQTNLRTRTNCCTHSYIHVSL